MPQLKWSRSSRSASLLVCQVALMALPCVAFAQRGDGPGRSGNAAKSGPALSAPVGVESPQYLGMRRCALCHNQSAMPDPEVSREFCLMNESGVFRRDDKHVRAYELMVVPGGLGEQMGKKLDIDVRKAKECLSCHSGASAAAELPPPSYESGVTCESCHGASSRWDQPHSEPAWRKRTAAEKEALGMVDVRDPVRRAKVCYSCHIGNTEEGKVVTHEMYAAGHPPLPGIEIETFVSAMPAHWRLLPEKGNFQYRDEYLQSGGRAASSGSRENLPRTQAVLVGGIVALRESLRLLATQARTEDRPELAAFDCQSCHHELRSPAWRQNRPLLGRPGRPRPPEWPAVIASVSLNQLVVDKAALDPKENAFEAPMKRLHLALDSRPFGGLEMSAIINDAPDGLAYWLDQQARQLANSPIDETAARKVLQQLYASGSTGSHDFHSARQIAWAIRTIESELQSLPYPTFTPRGEASLTERVRRENDDARILSEWRRDHLEPATNEVRRLWDPVSTSLKLELPSGTKKSVVEFMSPSLSAISDYDPEKFRNLLKQVAKESDKVGPSAQRLTTPARR